MSLLEIFLIAIGLSADAFAVAICMGLNMKKATFKKAIIVGLYFGLFQAIMPLIGYFVATLFSEKIIKYDHWIAFALLLFLGGKMIVESLKKEKPTCPDRKCSKQKCSDRDCPTKTCGEETSLKFTKMLPFALATSIDALAIGVSFAFMKVEIFSSISIIGAITLLLSAIGVKLGNLFGAKIKGQAEIIGGIILVLIGVKILLEHLGVINF